VIPGTDSARSLIDYLWHWESTSPDRPFVSDGTGASYSYAETAAAVRALSAEYGRRDVGPGDRAAILAENSAPWIVAFLAGLASGLIVVPLTTRLTTDELNVLLDNADPGVIAVDPALLPLVAPRWRDRTMLLSDPLPIGAAISIPIDGDAPACLTYTSGTTSRPKGVLLSNVALTRASETYAALFHSTPAMHTIVAVPLCHNTGFVDQLGHALVAGGSIEAHRRFHADEIARRLLTGECTYFIGVPTMYHRIVEHLTGTQPCELDPWLAFGGAPMPSQVIVRLHDHFPRAQLVNCYGLSEATSITHVNFVTSGSTATDVGVAVAGTIDSISPSGELLIRSPTAMLGYYGDPGATVAKFENGWLRTGDLAARADDGMVQVFGRVDDVINRGGEKVVPLEVEEALCAHPSVVEAAVVGLPDEQYGSIIAAAVVTSEPIAFRDLALFLEGSLADYKRPAQIVDVDELPRNQNGKVVPSDVRDLINRLLNGFDAQP
jgi:acyl-CoA synthetase (AMP-forming)/AMP-acid ligase II